MNLGIIGCGAIGTDVAKAADAMNEIKKIYLYDSNKKVRENVSDTIIEIEVENMHDAETATALHVDVIMLD
ncbi:unnamed protein product, partial [marine sediment metagenome]